MVSIGIMQVLGCLDSLKQPSFIFNVVACKIYMYSIFQVYSLMGNVKIKWLYIGYNFIQYENAL